MNNKIGVVVTMEIVMRIVRPMLFFTMMLILLSGCATLSREATNKIVRPENKVIPLQGNWIIKNCYEETDNKSMVDSAWIGKVFQFEGNSIIFNGSSWENVNYKIKRVNAKEYFLHRVVATSDSIGASSGEIQVITASSEDKYLYEFIKLDDERIIASIDNQLYCMTKAENGTEGIYGGIAKDIDESDEIISNYSKSKKSVQTGLLLGIRIPEQISQKGTEEKLEEYRYKTYWISMTNRETGPVLSADDIFLPRKDGFWKLNVRKILGSEGIEDTISAVMVSSGYMKKSALDESTSDKLLRMETKLRRTILYVGNDYICTENVEEIKESDTSEKESKKVLRTVPVDNIANPEGIKLSDLTGENGSLAMEGAISGLLASSNNNSISKIIEEDQEQNFALFRKTGHWFFKGRVSLEPGEPMAFVDFNINLIPPADMVAYDILHIPWTIIKDTVPLAIDAYTSPNKDLAIILTRNAILLYAMENGELAQEPLNKLDIPDGSMVIMAEWATADYVEYWEKSFTRNNQTEQVQE